MGTSQATKAENHDRIVHAASVMLRDRGAEGVSVGDVMGAVSLTHGGFYAHFANRDELIDEATRRAFAEALTSFEAALAAHPVGGIVGFVDVYLSPVHQKNRERGCAVAALAGDVARSSETRRTLFAVEFGAYVDRMIEITGGHLNRQQAASTLSALAGAVSVSRALNDRKLAKGVIEGTRTLVLSAFGEDRNETDCIAGGRGSG